MRNAPLDLRLDRVARQHCGRSLFKIRSIFGSKFGAKPRGLSVHRWLWLLLGLCFLCGGTFGSVNAADSRFARSDSDARFLHHIDLYDSNNRKITPESDQPYSPLMTCGRCHDYESISHGWHFNAFMSDGVDGRRGEPWIWSEERTGTQLPLSYRDWEGMFHPDQVGLTPWQMTLQFGGRIPGGGLAAGDSANEISAATKVSSGGEETSGDEDPETADRWEFSGALQIDCMTCHASEGVYDINARRDQITDQNFAWAATAGIRLGTIDGKVSRIKDGADLEDEAVQKQLPKVSYTAARFNSDGTVFMDLIRKPANNACYQCHSQRTVSDQGIESRWAHDGDVHLLSGMACTDCHRNSIDHKIIRGYEGESERATDAMHHVVMETLTCAGCHLGVESTQDSQPLSMEMALASRAGRLGSPKPLHAGLPAIHFEKLSCTACHSGTIPRSEAIGMMTSLAHSLGEKGHRTGQELPRIVGPVFDTLAANSKDSDSKDSDSKDSDSGKVYPQRAMWPAFWATVSDGVLTPIDPSKIYDLTRRSLRVRRGFVEEIVYPELSSSEKKETLGEERAKADESEWTEEEIAKVAEARTAAGEVAFNEKVYAAIDALEEELGAEAVVYVSSGFVYKRGETENTVEKMVDSEIKNRAAVEMLSWPIGHNVRPAGWSLGVGGCVECHSDDSAIFASTVQSVGPGPDRKEALTMASLRGLDPNQTLLWNQMFQGRSLFKLIIAGSLAVLCTTLLIGVGAIAGRLGRNVFPDNESA